MVKKSNTKDFIEKSIKVHGNKYDYSKVVYVNNSTKVEIICPEHGSFWQLPAGHLRGSECLKCFIKKERLTTEQFISKAKQKYGDKYDYSKVNYVDGKTKICIICPKHGEFWQLPFNHLRQNCPKCRKLKTVVKGIGIVDCLCNNKKAKQVWISMLKRCYSEKYQNNKPTYIGCTVCDEWIYFSNFKKWFDENYIEGFQLDKDIIVKGNKVYSPNTCCFVPQEINMIIYNKNKRKYDLPKGVIKSKNNRYVASVNMYGEIKRLGCFSTPEEAFMAYKEAKEKYIKEVAEKWKDKIDIRAYNSLINYKVDDYMVKMTPNQMILTAVYQTMYLNELVCCCVHDMKPSMLKMDKETQKIYKAAYRRVRDYEKYMQKLMTTSGNVYVDFNDTMDCTVQPFLEKFKDELYDCVNSHSNAEFPYICTLVEVARTVTRFSITEIANRVKDTLKYDESAVSLYTYQQKELMTILDNLTKWVFRKVEDINFNDYPNVVNAWVDVEKAINNSDTIGAAIVKAQQMNDKEYESKN